MKWSNRENLSSLSLRCSVAFSKICPAGKGYFLQNIRETVAFPPIIFPRKPDKEGEWKTVETQTSFFLSFLCTVHRVVVILYHSVSFPSRADATGKILFLFLMQFSGLGFGVVRSDVLFQSGEAARDDDQRAGSYQHQRSSCAW